MKVNNPNKETQGTIENKTSKLQKVARTANFAISMKAIGKSLSFYIKHAFDGKVTRKEKLKKEDLYKDPEGLLELFTSDADKNEAIKKLGKDATTVFGARHVFFGKIIGKYVKIEDYEQVVYLGGGKDPRPMQKSGENPFRPKQDSKYKNVKYFVIDKPEVIEEVNDVYETHKELKNPRVKFIPGDFKVDNVVELLLKGGLDPTKKVLFICEGVTVYLAKETIINIFNNFKSNLKNKVTIAVDYQVPLKTKGDSSLQTAESAISNVKKETASPFTTFSDFKAEIVDKVETAQVIQQTTLPKLIMDLGLGTEPVDARESCNFMTLSLN